MSNVPIILITGANTGIGFETIKALLGSPNAYNVLLGGRSLQKAEDAVQLAKSQFPSSQSSLSAIQVDIESDISISNAFEEVSAKHGRVDVLINNAGAAFDFEVQSGRMSMREAWNKSWDVNTTGTQIMTHTFVPLLLKSSDPRLLFVTSGTATLAETEDRSIWVNKVPAKGWPKQATGVPAYRSSKTGMNMMMREWSRILTEDGVKVWCISPGFLATGLGAGQEANKKMGAGDPAIGGNFIKDVVEGKRDQDVGTVIRTSSIQPW
ncbi:hypothetical protein V494_05223 [Pseudogymnoascus sp. VKM F-4513 (FW-928)]|nr:hypothetical protein V494_05223 [Pseudogymnoascus sp. VKM F-4513 (FW-928)]